MSVRVKSKKVKNINGIPKYEPKKWNRIRVRLSTNCYCYALDMKKNHITGKSFPRYNGNVFALQPGELSGNKLLLEELSVDTIVSRVMADAKKLGILFIKKPIQGCPCGSYEVALFLDPGVDYHWYRKDKNGTWSHKPSNGFATNKDASGRKILNPRKADRDYLLFNYQLDGGAFCVCKHPQKNKSKKKKIAA